MSLEKTIRKHIGGESMLSLVGGTFRRMEIAEEEIAAAKKRFPVRTHRRLTSAFGVLVPPPILRTKGDPLYRAHVREMIERAARSEDFEPGTLAECLAAISEMSLRSPLTSGWVATMERCFHFCFPQEDLGPDLGRGSWPKEVEENIAGLRKKLRSKRS